MRLGRYDSADMKLFKIIRVQFNHGVSVFPPADQELPPAEELLAEPFSDLIHKFVMYGYSSDAARKIVITLAFHARTTLNQDARGARIFIEMCIKQLPVPIPAVPLAWHALALFVAVVAAVSLGLYLWGVLDKEFGLLESGHKWAYLMSYGERFWQAEILNVGLKQEGLYEQGPELGDVVRQHVRDFQLRKREDWLWLRPGSVVLEGRYPILYHVLDFLGFYVFYIGLMSNFGLGLYKLRDPALDRYKPGGPWSRPGGRMFTPEYDGAWGEWWWF